MRMALWRIVAVTVLIGCAVAAAEDVDCEVSAFVLDGPCSEACGGGFQMALRTVLVEPTGNGAACPPLAETIPCNTEPCPVVQPELRVVDGHFELRVGSNSTFRVLQGSRVLDILAKLGDLDNLNKDDITAVESDLALLSADLRATRDIVFANREHVDMGLFNVSAELRNLQNSKVDYEDLATKADSSEVDAFLATMKTLNADLQAGFDSQHGFHNASLNLLFDEIGGVNTIVSGLLTRMDAAEQLLANAQDTIADLQTALSKAENERSALETRLAAAEAKIDKLVEAVENIKPNPYGRGKDGALNLIAGGTVTAQAYALLVDAPTGVDALQLDSCTGLNADDELLLHQTQYKDGTFAGRYLFVEVRAVHPSSGSCLVYLKTPLATEFRSGVYSMSGPYAAQAVRVAQHTNAVISGTYNAPAWDGKKGGIIAIKATGSVTINGLVDAAGRGFRGAPQRPANTDYSCGFAGESEAAVFGGANGLRDCRSFGSGGGPGNGQGGGYGGGHASVGNKPSCGGCDASCGSGASISGVTGVAPSAPAIVGFETFLRIYFGGSGAGSGSHNGGGRNSARGGASGGIVFIAGKDGVTGTGKIRVRGSNGMSGYPSSSGQPMGGGGGGSGGSIWLRSTGDMAVATLEVNGGTGGSSATGNSCSPGTAGGAGGAGRVYKETTSA